MVSTELLVSIGCPTYNRPAGLRRMLECLINQTYSNLEIIVSDNCSPGAETEQVVQAFSQTDSRIKYFRQKQNVGVFNNFKFLLEQAQGDYFAWAADDDFRHAEYIEACMKEFERLKSPLLINSYSTLVDSRSNQVIAIDRGCSTVGMSARDRYIKYISTIYTEQAAVGDVLYGVIRREAAVNAMRDQPNILGWDHTFLARLALDGEFYTIPRELMGSSAFGVSTDSHTKTADSQLIRGSLSEKMPVWVRQTYQQQTIQNSSHLSRIEKISLSLWSYRYYFLTHGLKMWVKGISFGLFGFLKQTIQPFRSAG